MDDDDTVEDEFWFLKINILDQCPRLVRNYGNTFEEDSLPNNTR